MVQAAAAFCTMSVAACGVSTTEQAYTAPLIQQVGAGSSAVARLVPTLQAEAKTAAVFNDPTLQQPVRSLARGMLRVDRGLWGTEHNHWPLAKHADRRGTAPSASAVAQ
jgi:hypothetical protein